MTNHFRIFSLIALGAGLLVQARPSSAKAEDPYRLSASWDVGGEGGWDYVTVDPLGHRVFLPRTTHTMVLDLATGKVIADIPGQQRNHGVALVPGVNRGFISDGGDGSVTVFDLKTYAVLGKVRAERDADGIVYDPASDKVLVVSGDGGALIPISPGVDLANGQADPAVDLGGKPEYLVADGRGRVYINLVDKNVVAVVDTASMTVIGRWPTAPGGAPTGLSMDRVHRRLFIGCRRPQKLVVMNADDGKVLADFPIGAGVDATQFDGEALASCRDGTLTVVREVTPNRFEFVQELKTAPGARTMGLDPETGDVFLPTADFEPQTGATRWPAIQPGTFRILVVRRSGS